MREVSQEDFAQAVQEQHDRMVYTHDVVSPTTPSDKMQVTLVDRTTDKKNRIQKLN